jgi:glycosyltransferase involved in cell wall biosynthesis
VKETRILSVGRIVIDGLNLGLKHETGISTYGYNLARLLRQLGLGVDVLYDGPVRDRADQLKLELGFYGEFHAARRQGRILSRFPIIERLTGAMPLACRAITGARATVIRTDIVVASGVLPHHPEDAGIVAAAGIFRAASLSGVLLHRPLSIDLPAGSALHLTYPIPLLPRNGPVVMTVHDIIPLRLPHTVHDRKFRFLHNLRLMASRADHIIAVSESARRDLLQAISLPPEKVSVAYQPVRPVRDFDRDLAPRVVEEMFGLRPGEYFLFAGAVEPKKNLPRLIDAYLMSGAQAPLIIVGPDGWMVEEQLAPLRRYQEQRKQQRGKSRKGAREKIRRLGYVSRSQLAALLSQARALLFPSIYEGFGLPIAEAMQLGVSVLTGSLGSLPEIAGDAALITDPFDTAAIARGIRQLDRDAALREELRQRGLRNVARFSDENCRAMLATAYQAAGIASAAGQ